MVAVFVVTDGEYADYGIRGIWSTREKADAHVAKLIAANKGPFDRHVAIEEWDLDEEC